MLNKNSTFQLSGMNHKRYQMTGVLYCSHQNHSEKMTGVWGQSTAAITKAAPLVIKGMNTNEIAFIGLSQSEVAQSCPTLCNPMDCSLLGFSVHGIFQARVLEWVAISFSRGSSWPRDRTQVSCIAGRHFTLWATREVVSKRVGLKQHDGYLSLIDSPLKFRKGLLH